MVGGSDENDPIKKAFSKVKDEILRLEAELSTNKQVVEILRNELSQLKKSLELTRKEESSTGNEGVYSARTQHALCTHSARTHYALTLPIEDHFETPIEPKNDLEKAFLGLKNYELKTFLVIYQLDQEKGRANYYEIAQKMGVSDACVRSYVSSLLRKNVPLLKTKLNKNRTVLSINPSFKSLDTYQKLLSLYYQQSDYGQQSSLSSFQG